MRLTRPNRRTAAALSVSVAVAVGLVTLATNPSKSPTPSAKRSGPSTSTPPSIASEPNPRSTSKTEPGRVRVVVDGSVDAGHPDAARMVGAGGLTADVVRDELVVSVRSSHELERIVDRLDATVASDLGTVGVWRDVVLHIPTSSRFDAEATASALNEVEPDLSGDLRLSDRELGSLLQRAATEVVNHGTRISLQPVANTSGISDATTYENVDMGTGRNSFGWSYLGAGGALDIAVAPAWQLLEAHDKLHNGARFMIVDGGFAWNRDLPEGASIRKGEWYSANPWTCTGGSACPWHGTNVAAAAMAAVGNDFGTAGPAGVLDNELVAVRVADNGVSRTFETLKMLDEVVADERPDIVNMSFGTRVLVFRAAAQDIADRRVGRIREYGALVFAAAGNDGLDVDTQACVFNRCYESSLWVPCEIEGVICVGGTQTQSTYKADGSNYGSRGGDRSVDIYAPYCVRVYEHAKNAALEDATKTGCGTSYSSPFVAGVAALIWAADPSLSAGEVWATMRETAHAGGVGFPDVIKNQRRIDAFDAVAMALGVDVEPPTVRIDFPSNGRRFPIGTWVDLRATATDMHGNELPVAWSSDRDGSLTLTPTRSDFSVELSPGRHEITATVFDTLGQSGRADLTIEIADAAPTATIVAPLAGALVPSDAAILLVGTAKNPDTYATLPADALHWDVLTLPSRTRVLQLDGPTPSIPANTLTAGSYRLRLRASGAGGAGTAEVDITIEAPDPQSPTPAAVIVDPDLGDEFFTDGSVSVFFRGYGVVPATPTSPSIGIAGTRLRWTARSEAGHVRVLCVGSNVPGANSPGSIVVHRDCSDFEADLDLGGAVGQTTWTITLEAFAADGSVGTGVTSVIVSFATG